MKKISIVIPTYNEEDNIMRIFERVTAVMSNKLNNYLYDIIFVDNHSSDNTRNLIENLAEDNKNVKAIFNAKNFGFSRNIFHGLTQSDSDCAFLLFADMQDPPELLPDFVKKWEEGFKIVVGIKKKSKENKVLWLCRTLYYKVIKLIADTEQIEHFTGYGLYDKKFIDVLKTLDDSNPYLKGIVAELGFNRTEIYYEQEVRKAGKSSFNFMKMYDLAMVGITCYSKAILRLATFVGFACAIVSLLIGLVTFVNKLLHWESYSVGIAALMVGVFFLGGVQLLFLGILGEYVMNINTRVLKRPLVIEEKRINFDDTL